MADPSPQQRPPKGKHARFEARTSLPVAVQTLYDWHAASGAFDRLGPPWERLRIKSRSGSIAAGARLVMQLKQGPFWLTWEALHHAYSATDGSLGFVDEQVRGPFASWWHTHRMAAVTDSEALLSDEIQYRLPLGFFGRWVMGGVTRRRLERMFHFRHERTAMDLARHEAFKDRGSQRIVISGASGMIGTALTAFLGSGGHHVQALVRREARGPDEIAWDPTAGTIDAAALEGADAVIHLAGANVAGGRWSDARKKLIRDSRADGTQLLAETLAALTDKPRVLLSTSAIGYYGDAGEAPIDESSPRGEGFLADVCAAWEAAADAARSAGIRVVHPRIGVVLSPGDGALAKLLTPFKLGVGGRVGSGRQGMSWITLDDVVGALHFLVFQDAVAGPVNLVAPNPVSNRNFSKVLAKVLRRPSVLPLPGFAVKAMLGEMGASLLLAGAFVAPNALGAAGFRWDHPELEPALRFMLGR